ncbi:hypothetical protein AgCh_038454 [Apium graveolens]
MLGGTSMRFDFSRYDRILLKDKGGVDSSTMGARWTNKGTACEDNQHVGVRLSRLQSWGESLAALSQVGQSQIASALFLAAITLRLLHFALARPPPCLLLCSFGVVSCPNATIVGPHISNTTTVAKDPGTASKEQPRHQELSFGARRRGSPFLGLVVVGIFETMARTGKYTSERPSASTQVQEPDHSQAQDPRADQETLQEQPLQHTPVMERIVNTRDARTLIELNQYKYTNVPVADEHMANLTSNELEKAIRLYR